MKKLILIRHGETDWNYEHRLQGQQDLPLNHAGIEQAERLATRLASEPIDTIYSSDLERAHETANIINAHHNLLIRTDQRLREIAFGKYEGMTQHDIQRRYPQEYSAWVKDQSIATHGGETVSQLGSRVKAILDQIEMHKDEHNILVVGHGGPLRMLICLALRMPENRYWRFRMGNTALSELEMQQNSWVLVRMNDQAHLYNPSE